jgi:uncharacterized protein with HEPN domain
MSTKSLKLLEDMRAAATFILEATAGLSLAEYRSNKTLRFAVERNFEIIGEAVNRLSRLDPDMAAQIPDQRRIVAFRNLLIHAYDVIDDAQVWDVVTGSLPAFHQQVEALLHEND